MCVILYVMPGLTGVNVRTTNSEYGFHNVPTQLS